MVFGPFSDLTIAISLIDTPYTLVTQQITTNSSGVDSISSSVESIIWANLQNFHDGEQGIINVNNTFVYRTIIILTSTRIGFGDPVYDGSAIQYILEAYGQQYRLLMEGGVQEGWYNNEQDGYVYYRYHAELIRVTYDS